MKIHRFGNTGRQPPGNKVNHPMLVGRLHAYIPQWPACTPWWRFMMMTWSGSAHLFFLALKMMHAKQPRLAVLRKHTQGTLLHHVASLITGYTHPVLYVQNARQARPLPHTFLLALPIPARSQGTLTASPFLGPPCGNDGTNKHLTKPTYCTTCHNLEGLA